MAMDRKKFEELCSAYVLNALEGVELQKFRKALKEADVEMRSIYEEMRWASLHLSLSPELVDPPVHVKENIIRTIHSQPSRKPENIVGRIATFFGLDRPRIALAAAFALLVIVAGLSFYTFFLGELLHQRDQQLAVLHSDLSVQRQQFAALENELTRKEEILKVLQSPRIELVIMNGQEVNPSGYGKIIWDPIRKAAILQISNLPPVPKDKDYQLWVIKKGQKPISAGVFTISDPVKETFFKIERLIETDKKSINAFAITLEPKGGVLQPTGKMYLLGSPSS